MFAWLPRLSPQTYASENLANALCRDCMGRAGLSSPWFLFLCILAPWFLAASNFLIFF